MPHFITQIVNYFLRKLFKQQCFSATKTTRENGLGRFRLQLTVQQPEKADSDVFGYNNNQRKRIRTYSVTTTTRENGFVRIRLCTKFTPFQSLPRLLEFVFNKLKNEQKHYLEINFRWLGRSVL